MVSEAEVDAFLQLCCFFDDPVDVGNLISGSSALKKKKKKIQLEHLEVQGSCTVEA